MKIDIKRNTEHSLIQQIYLSIKDQILTDKLENGASLPSIRGLAKDLEVSMVTVSKAYTLLEKEGIIKTVRGKGTFVLKQKNEELEQGPTIPPEKVNDKRFKWQDTLADYLPSTRAFDSVYPPAGFLFDSAKISQGLLAGTITSEETKAIFRQHPNSLYSYADIQGDLELRKHLSYYLMGLNLNLSPSELLVTSGIQQGIDLIARTFIGQGDIVIVEAPTYSPAIDTFRSWGATILSVPIDKDGMQVDILEELCSSIKPKVIYTNPNFQNPTGMVLSQKRREKLLQIAKKHHILIIEDDSWSELSFNESSLFPIKSLDDSGHVIFLKGFSKWLSPGCRIASLSANGSILNRLLAAKKLADLGSPLFPQKLLGMLLQSENLSQHIEVLREALSNRAELMVSILKEKAPEGITWTKPTGGLSLWVTCPSWFNTDLFDYKLKAKGISILPGSVCFPTETEYNHMRLCFSYLSEEQIEKGMTLFCEQLNAELVNHQTNPSPQF